MTKETIAAALDAEGISAGKDGRFAVPENREVVCIIATAGDVVPVEKVTALELRPQFITLENSKRERFYFTYDSVLGLRMLAGQAARDRVAAGFGR
jgi:hypothetical protein